MERIAHGLGVEPQDGEIFQACLDVFGLTGDSGDVKLLVVATQED